MKKGLLKKIIGQTYIWVLLILMYLPILILIAYSFSDTLIGKDFVFTWDLYKALFSGPNSEKIWIALGNTVLIAIISASVSTFLGTLGAIGAHSCKKKMAKTIDAFSQINIVNAEIVIAFSLTVMFVFLGTYVFQANLFSFWTLLIGHVALSIPFVYISVKPKLEQMDPSLYEAAIDLGATPTRALTKIVLPEIMPGILSGFLLSITLSLDDFIVTSFTRGAGLLSGNASIETLSTYIQASLRRKGVPNEMRALVTFIVIIVILAVVALSLYRYFKSKKEIRGIAKHVRA